MYCTVTSLFGLGIAAFHFHTGAIRSATFVSLVLAIGAVGHFALGPLISGTGVLTSLVIAYVRIPPLKMLVFLGSISYSLYLLHIPVGSRIINLVTRLGESSTIEIIAIGVATLTSIAVSYIFFRYVEKPSQIHSSKLGRGKTF